MKLRAVCAALAGVGLFAFASSSSAAGGLIAFTQPSYALDESAGTLTVTVRRSGDLSAPASVRYTSAGNTVARSGSDYQLVTGTLSWAAGEADKSFAVGILQDTVPEEDETFTLTLAEPAGGTLGGATAQVLVRDDEPAQFNLLPRYSAGEKDGTAAITVQRLGRQAAGTASVSFSVVGASATAGSDFTAAGGTLSWSAGEPSNKSFPVAIIDDTAIEADETANIALSNPLGGSLGRKTAVLTLVSDDIPAASVADIQTDEGNSGYGTASFTVTLSPAGAAPATVSYALAAGSASAKTDFEPQSGTLSFAPGETQKTIAARVVGDTVKEGSETFKLILSAPDRLSITRGTATATIRDNDNPASADPQLGQPALEAALRGCDLLDAAHCLFPFPSDQFTTAAAPQSVQSAARGGTGRRVNLNILAMPRNVAGKPIDPTEWNRNDGFSPGQLIATYVNGLSLERTFGLPSGDIGVANIGLSQSGPQNPKPAIMVLEVPQAPEVFAPREHLVWSEVDANANLLVRPEGTEVSQPAGGQAALLIRPAKNFTEGRRYVVVLRNLRNAQGLPIAAADAFKVCRDRAVSMLPAVTARCSELESKVFPVLDAAGIVRDASLYMAWDFTVASTENQIGRIRRMRDDAFASLSNAPAQENCTQYRDDAPCRAPGFVVDKVTDAPQGGIARRIEGTITVPSYLVPSDASPLEDPAIAGLLHQLAAQFPGQFGDVDDVLAIGGGASAPPNRLFYNPTDRSNTADPAGQVYGDGLPDRAPGGGTMTTRFMCQIPAQATPQQPARPGIYGHGLLDSRSAVTYDGVPDISREFNYMFCAVDWYGFATGDLPNVASTLVDLSNFPVVPDASQQGILNFAFLARLLRDSHGFAAHPAFQMNGLPVFDRTEVFYDGNSQGGIMGGAVLALSKDVNRGALGSLGMNYSTLLQRSTDFDLYAIPLYLAYQNPLDRDLAFSLIQMLWDRSENNGYAAHIVDNSAFRGPANAVKLDPNFGDHQVTMYSADVMARTMGIPVDAQQTARVAALKGQARRAVEVQPNFALAALDFANPQQAAGGALIRWDDTRTEIPPVTNTPPRTGRDPHDDSAKKFSGRCQKAHFLRTGGQLVDITGVEFDRAACPAVAPAPPTTAAGTLLADAHQEPHFPLCANGVCVADIPLVGETLAGALIHSLLDTLCGYYWVDAICSAVVVNQGTPSTGGTVLQHFVGAAHEHSSYSDGDPNSIPRDYFNAARNAGLDFLLSSEHADNEKLPITTSAACIQFFANLPNGTLSPSDAAMLDDCSHATDGDHYHKWGATLAQSLEASTERFTGVRGFEWTNDFHGHLNVYFPSNVTNAKNDGGYADMVHFWSWLQT
ncbi:MAG TPA: Calx-beta domain-containing protein, partial [Solimonas sp.]|nr:Calx-beta domain-containing protein [Solimonas sp.]